MGSSKSSSDATKSYDYFGTIAGVVRAGRIDRIDSLLVDGKSVWDGPISRTADGIGNPYTLSITDSKWLRDGGYVRVYWGEDDQTDADDALPGHPPYRGIAYVVLHRFLFGRERTTAPNVELICAAEARPSVSAISSTTMDDDCVNPWAVAAELLTSPHGVGLPVARLNLASFQAAHDIVAAKKALCYVAPWLGEQLEASRAISDILAACEGLIRYDDDGLIEAVQLEPDPGNLADYQTLDANHLTAPPQVRSKTWDSVPTGVVIRFRDRDRQFKESSLAIDDIRALRAVGEPRREQIDRLHVIRRDQAAAQAAEWVKRNCQPTHSISISVRREWAKHLDGSLLRPGDRFVVDIDPEPGGTAANQLCRVVRRSVSMTGPVKIEAQSEPNQPPYISTPAYTPPAQDDLEVPAITQARIFSLPVGQTDDEPSVLVLASRPGDLVSGCFVEFDVESGAGTFTRIGTQTGFAVRGNIRADIGQADLDDSVYPFEVADTRDEAILSGWVGGKSAAENDELLLVVYQTNGRFVDEDADKLPILECLSIKSQEQTAAHTFNLTVLRGRLSTRPRPFVSGDVAWIVRRSALVPHRHQNFPAYMQQSGTELTFRLRPFTVFAEYDGTPSNLPFYFSAAYLAYPVITWSDPTDESYTLASDGNLTPAATITDADGNLVRIELVKRRVDTGETTTVFNCPFDPTASKTLADCFTATGVSSTINFAGQSGDDTFWELEIRATDESGAISKSKRYLTREATGGPATTMQPIQFYYPSGTVFWAAYAYITGLAPGTQMHWALEYSPARDTPPVGQFDSGTDPDGNTTRVRDASGDLYYIVTGSIASLPVYIAFTCRLWARVSNGTTHGPWAYRDYVRG